MAAHRAPHLDPRPARDPLQAADDACDRHAPCGDAHLARAALPREARARRRNPRRRLQATRRGRHRLHRSRRAQLAHEQRADLFHGLDRGAHPRRPARQALPPPAAAVARLLRAEPRWGADQPPHERRRGTRPARHRRCHEPLPEHADPHRLGRDPLRPRLEARARHPRGLPVHGDRDGAFPHRLRARLPGGPRTARPRHGNPRRGHRRHEDRAGIQPPVRERTPLPGGQRPLPRGEPRHGRDQRPLLPVRRFPVHRGDRDRARLRRLSLLREQPHDRHAPRLHALPLQLLRSGAAAVPALQHVSRRGRRAGQDHRGARRGAGNPGRAGRPATSP